MHEAMREGCAVKRGLPLNRWGWRAFRRWEAPWLRSGARWLHRYGVLLGSGGPL